MRKLAAKLRGTKGDTSDLHHADYERLYDTKQDYVDRRISDSFEAQRIKLEVAEFKIPNLLAVLPPSFRYSSVIEVGCATGDLLAAFPAQVNESVEKIGFDISALNVNAARERYPGIEFRTTDFTEYEGCADIVILSDILEHVPDDVQFLERASKLGRIILVNLPLEQNWLNARRKYGIDDHSGHLRAYSLRTGLDLLTSAGLDVVRYIQTWSHESMYDQKRRALRAQLLGKAFAGSSAVRGIKALAHFGARQVPPFGRRFYSSNLFASVKRGI